MEKGYFDLLGDYAIIANHDNSKEHSILLRQILNRECQKIQLPTYTNLYPSVEYIRRHRKI